MADDGWQRQWKVLGEGERRGAQVTVDVWSLLETTLGAEEGLRVDQGCNSSAHSQCHLTVTSHLRFFISASPLTHTAALFSRSLPIFSHSSSVPKLTGTCTVVYLPCCHRITVITSEFCSYTNSLKNSYYLSTIYKIKCTFLEMGLHSNSG